MAYKALRYLMGLAYLSSGAVGAELGIDAADLGEPEEHLRKLATVDVRVLCGAESDELRLEDSGNRGTVDEGGSASKSAPSWMPSSPSNAVEAQGPSLLALRAAREDAHGREGIFEYADYSGHVVDHADVIVVGSGAGGGVLAEQLASKGKNVLVVEAGPYVRPHEFRQDLSHTFSRYFWEGGMRALRGAVIIPTMQARCLGGTTVFNCAICMRPSPHALDVWAREEGVEGHSLDELSPHLDAVEEIMNIRPTRPAVQGRRNELFRDGLEALGWEGGAIRRNTADCVGSAGCLYGCRNGAKVSTDRCVERATEHGAVVYTSITIERLVMNGDRVRGVEGTVRHPTSHQKSYGARFTARDCVVLAAGVMATPQIMQRSGLEHRGIGANLRIHPSLYALGTFDERVTPWSGATQGWHCTEFIEYGIKLESLWADAGVLSEKFPSNPEKFQRYVKDYERSAAWAGWVSGEDSVGAVRALPGGRADFAFELGEGDVRRLQEANAKLAELFLAAGANEVFTGIDGAPEAIRSERDIRRIRTGRFDAIDLPTGSNHVFGTTAMGGDPDRHVCDSDGAVYVAQDLFVCDTGLFPRTPGVNPQETIMAIAHRMGETLADRY